jgi:hypothetical protein
MPILNQLVQYNTNYDGSNWESPNINLANVASIQFICYSSVNCSMSVSWFTSLEDETIIYQDNQLIVGGESGIIQVTTRTEYAKFSVSNFASNPVLLFNTSGMYFLQNNIASQGIQGATGAPGMGITGATGAMGIGFTGATGAPGATGISSHTMSFNYGSALSGMVDLGDYFGSSNSTNAIDCYSLINQPITIHSITTFLGTSSGSTGSTGTRTIRPYVNDALETDYEITYTQPEEGYQTVAYEKYFASSNNLICMNHITTGVPFDNTGLVACINYTL